MLTLSLSRVDPLAISDAEDDPHVFLGVSIGGLGVSVASGGASGPPGTFTLKADAGATARASFVPADNGGCGGDALMKLDGVLWPF